MSLIYSFNNIENRYLILKIKNKIINKGAAQTIKKCKDLLYFKAKIKDEQVRDKNIVNLKIIVIIQENIEVLHIA